MSGPQEDYLEAEPLIVARLKTIVGVQTPYFKRGDSTAPPPDIGMMGSISIFAATVAEIWTIAYLGSGSWSVTGSISGAQAPAATGTAYTNAYIGFTITAGMSDFATDDNFVVDTCAFAFVGGSTDAKRIYSDEAASPAAYVVFGGDKVDEKQVNAPTDNTSACTMTTWLWWVVVAVRDASDIQKMQPARAIAGPLISKVINSLRGFAPSVQYKPLRRSSSDTPAYTDDGYAYFPLKFSTIGVS